MEILVARGFQIEGIVGALRSGSMGWTGERHHMRHYRHFSVFATDPAELNAPQAAQVHDASESLYVFDGYCSRKGEFFHPLLTHTSTRLPHHIDEMLTQDLAGRSIDAGVFVAGRLNDEGLTLVTDPLSQYPLFYFQSGDRFLLSNVLRHVTVALEAHGLPATPSLIPCVESLTFGGSLGDETWIEEIRRVPFGAMTVAGQRLNFPQTPRFNVDLPYEEIIARAHEALSRHMLSVAQATDPWRCVVADVTGGAGSRLVLSLTLDSAFRDEMAGRCATQYPDPDANVAGAILEKYHLPIAHLPLVVTSDLRLEAPRDMEACAAFTGGTIAVKERLPTIAFPNLVHFTGRFGELGGAIKEPDLLWDAHHAEVDIPAVVDAWLERARASTSTDLVTAKGLAMVRDRALSCLRAIQEEGVAGESLLAEFDLRTRSRSRSGLSAWLANKSKISPDPLASPWLVAARRALPPEQYRRNKVIFDLLRAGGHRDLLDMPMADQTWSTTIVPLDVIDEYSRLEAVDKASPALSSLDGPLSKPSAVLSSEIFGLLGDKAVLAKLRANRQQGRSGEAGLQQHSQETMQRLLKQIPVDHVCWKWIKREKVALWAQRPDPGSWSSDHADILARMTSGLIWAAEAPTPAGVTELRNFGDYQFTPVRRAQTSLLDQTSLLEKGSQIPTDPRITVGRELISTGSILVGQLRTKTFAHLLTNAAMPKKKTLLDLGAGHCMFTVLAARLGYQVTAVDARTERVPPDLGSARFINCDVREFDVGGFGVVAILGLLYHLDINDQLDLLKRCAYGARVIVETQVHAPEIPADEGNQEWRQLVYRDGYCGVEYPEKQTLMASVVNPVSFWHTEQSIIRLFAEAGYSSVTLIDPFFTSPKGARRFYLLSSDRVAPGGSINRSAHVSANA